MSMCLGEDCKSHQFWFELAPNCFSLLVFWDSSMLTVKQKGGGEEGFGLI